MKKNLIMMLALLLQACVVMRPSNGNFSQSLSNNVSNVHSIAQSEEKTETAQYFFLGANQLTLLPKPQEKKIFVRIGQLDLGTFDYRIREFGEVKTLYTKIRYKHHECEINLPNHQDSKEYEYTVKPDRFPDVPGMIFKLSDRMELEGEVKAKGITLFSTPVKNIVVVDKLLADPNSRKSDFEDNLQARYSVSAFDKTDFKLEKPYVMGIAKTSDQTMVHQLHVEGPLLAGTIYMHPSNTVSKASFQIKEKGKVFIEGAFFNLVIVDHEILKGLPSGHYVKNDNLQNRYGVYMYQNMDTNLQQPRKMTIVSAAHSNAGFTHFLRFTGGGLEGYLKLDTLGRRDALMLIMEPPTQQ